MASIVLVLLVVSVLGLLFTAGLTRVDWHLLFQTRNRHIAEVQMLRARLEMIYFDSAACGQSLVPQGLGTTPAELQQRSQASTLALLKPTETKVAAGPMFAVGANHGALKVKTLQMSTPTLVLGSTDAYLSYLEIAVETPDGVRPKPLRVPFYLVVDSATGRFKDCNATSQPDSVGHPTFTLEDHLCQTMKGMKFTYDPAIRSCIDTSIVTASGGPPPGGGQ